MIVLIPAHSSGRPLSEIEEYFGRISEPGSGNRPELLKMLAPRARLR